MNAICFDSNNGVPGGPNCCYTNGTSGGMVNYMSTPVPHAPPNHPFHSMATPPTNTQVSCFIYVLTVLSIKISAL